MLSTYFLQLDYLYRFESGFLVLLVMGFLFLFVTDVAYYGLRKMLDVLSSVMLRLGHRVVDRWLGDTIVAPRSVVAAGGDTGVLP